MAFLIQNTRTGDFIDGRDDTEWTMIRDYAKRFPTKLDAERWIAKNGIDDYPPIYKIVTESTAVKNINHYIAEAVEKKLNEEKRYDDEIVRKAFMTALGGKNWNNFVNSGYDGKLHTWNEINDFLVKAGANFTDCAKMSNKLEDLEKDYHYADCVYESCKKLNEEWYDKKKPYLIKNAKVGDVFRNTEDLSSEYKVTKVTPSKVYAVKVKDPNTTLEFKDKNSSDTYNETDPEWAKLYTIKESKSQKFDKVVEDNSWTMADGTNVVVTKDKVIITKKDGKKYWMPRWEWEHAFDDDGDMESGPSRREPDWRPMK